MYKQKYLKYKTKYLQQRGGIYTPPPHVDIDDGKYTIPSSKSLPQFFFHNFSNLQVLDFAAGSTISVISKNIFTMHDSIEKITLPSSITELCNESFMSCSKLESVTFENNSKLKTIGERAFYNCKALKTVNFGQPSSLIEIKKQAFQSCESLKSITIPKSVKKIGKYCFYYCSNLNEIIFEDTSKIQEISKRAFPIHEKKNLSLKDFPPIFDKIAKEQTQKYKSKNLTDFTTIGFEIQINGKYLSSSIYQNLTHIPVYEAPCTFSPLKWIIETDGSILEFVTPTFYVGKSNLKRDIQLLHNYFNTIFTAYINEYHGQNISQVIEFLNKIFNIHLEHKLIKIENNSLKSDDEYLGDRKNIKTSTDTTWDNIVSIMKDENTNSNEKDENRNSNIPYGVHHGVFRDIFEIEAINVAHTKQEIYNLFNDENVYPYVNNEIEKAYKDCFKEILSVEKSDTTGADNDMIIFTFLQYEIYRLMFYYVNSHLCSNKATQNNSNNNSYLSIILTRLKTHSVWFKFDILTFIKLGELQLSNCGKTMCTTMKENIKEIKEDTFTKLIETIVSNLVEEEGNKLLLVKAVNDITTDMYNKFIEITTQLLNKLAESSTVKRQLKCNKKLPTCGECVSNFLDYNRQFYGIRHDTYIENALVVEYRDVNLLLT